MKITTAKGPVALETLCDLAEPISVIMSDHATVTALAECAGLLEKPMPTAVMVIALVNTCAPAIKRHTKEIFTIIAAIVGKDYEEVCEQPIFQTFAQVKQAWNEDLRDFFISSTASENVE